MRRPRKPAFFLPGSVAKQLRETLQMFLFVSNDFKRRFFLHFPRQKPSKHVHCAFFSVEELWYPQ